jgi:hypothetical protein
VATAEVIAAVTAMPSPIITAKLVPGDLRPHDAGRVIMPRDDLGSVSSEDHDLVTWPVPVVMVCR